MRLFCTKLYYYELSYLIYYRGNAPQKPLASIETGGDTQSNEYCSQFFCFFKNNFLIKVRGPQPL